MSTTTEAAADVIETEPESDIKSARHRKSKKSGYVKPEYEKVIMEDEEFSCTQALKDMCFHCCKHEPGIVEPKEDEYLMHIGEVDKTTLLEVFFPCNSCYKGKILDMQEDSEEEHQEEEPDEHWAGRWDFILTMGNYSIGLGNIWRFPAFVYENGGGTALIPYFTVIILLAIPYAFLEVYLGQFAGRGPISIWAALPLLKGVGIFMVMVSFYISVYYNVVAAWSLHYLLKCFVEPLPWTYTSASWNKNTFWKIYTGDHNLLQNFSGKSPGEEYFDLRILNLNLDTSVQNDVHLELTLCLCVVWFVVFIYLVFGRKSNGKMGYIKLILRYIAFFILIVRASLLYGAADGVVYYLTPQKDKLKDPKIWGNAVVQVFFSLDVARGAWMAFASKNKFNNRSLFRHTLIIIALNCVTSLFCGFAYFLAIGHLAFLKEMPVDKVLNTVAPSAGMVFIVYAEAIQKIQYSRFYCILLFGTILSVALRTQIALCRSITLSITDELPKCMLHRQLFLFICICIAGFLHGLPIMAPFGIYLFNSLDKFTTSVGFLFAALVFCISIRWIYGHMLNEGGRFGKDFELMWGSPPNRYFCIMWSFVLPLATFIFMILVGIASEDNYRSPNLDNQFGFFFFEVLLVSMAYQSFKNYDKKKGIVVSLMASTLTTHLWGPQDPDVPYDRPDPPPDKKNKKGGAKKSTSKAEGGEETATRMNETVASDNVGA